MNKDITIKLSIRVYLTIVCVYGVVSKAQNDTGNNPFRDGDNKTTFFKAFH